jgi:hypothetical protein
VPEYKVLQIGSSAMGVSDFSAGGVPFKVIIPVMSPAFTDQAPRRPKTSNVEKFFMVQFLFKQTKKHNMREKGSQEVCEFFHKAFQICSSGLKYSEAALYEFLKNIRLLGVQTQNGK